MLCFPECATTVCLIPLLLPLTRFCIPASLSFPSLAEITSKVLVCTITVTDTPSPPNPEEHRKKLKRERREMRDAKGLNVYFFPGYLQKNKNKKKQGNTVLERLQKSVCGCPKVTQMWGSVSVSCTWKMGYIISCCLVQIPSDSWMRRGKHQYAAQQPETFAEQRIFIHAPAWQISYILQPRRNVSKMCFVLSSCHALVICARNECIHFVCCLPLIAMGKLSSSFF